MDDKLLAEMMTGVTSDPPWQAFVRTLRLAFGGIHASVLFRRPDIATMWMTRDADAALEAMGDLAEDYSAQDDPHWFFDMPAFKAHVLENFVSPTEWAQHPLTTRFLWRYGVDEFLLCRVQVKADMQAWLTVTRPSGVRFSDDDKRQFEHVARRFAPALELFGHYKEVLDQRDAYARALHARGTGIAQLDQQGHLLHLDQGAERWVAERKLIQRQANRLVAVRPQDQLRIEVILKDLLSGAKDEALILLQGDGATDTRAGLELLFYRVTEPYEPAWTHSPRVIVYMNMLGCQQIPSPQRLRQLFDLTGREAALTIVLARGLTVAEAATDLGLSPQTARSYLRQIFDKVGVTRQAELIRRIHASVAGID